MQSATVVIRFIALFSMLSVLAGCGFALRNTAEFDLAVESMNISSANAYSDFSRELERLVESRDIALVSTGADYSVRVLSENTSRRPLLILVLLTMSCVWKFNSPPLMRKASRL